MAVWKTLCAVGMAWVAGWSFAAAPPADPQKAGERGGLGLSLPRDVDLLGWKADFSGEVRLRGERWDDADLNRRLEDTDGRFFLRTKVRTDIAFSEELSARIDLLDCREWDSDRRPRSHNDELDLHQAYVQFDDLFAAPLMLRLGRQELDLGSRRLISAPTWSNSLRSFDAARLSWVGDAVDLHGFFGSVVVHEDDRFNEHRHGEAICGIFSTFKGLGGPKLGLYSVNLFSRKHEVAGEDGREGDHERHTLGTRLYGKLSPRWTYDLELAHQRGRYAHDRIRTWAFHADTAYTFDLPWQPTIQPLLNWATGDKDPDDGRRNTFDPLFACSHGPYGMIDFFHWMNVQELACRFKVRPARKLTVTAEVHRYWLDEDTDAWYTCTRRAKRRDRSGRSGDQVGHELSLMARYALSRQLTLEGGWARFFPGQFPRRTGPDDNADFWYLQTLFRF